MRSEGEVRLINGGRVYDERKPLEPSYPSIKPSIADFVLDRDVKERLSLNGEASAKDDGVYASDEEELRFAPPGCV